MTTANVNLLDSLRCVIGDGAMEIAARINANRPYDPTADLDEDTLRQSFGGLSRRARRQQRGPERLVVDELGYDQHGRYHADRDGAW